jgi:hypothetical protein
MSRALVLDECGLLTDEYLAALTRRIRLWQDCALALEPKDRGGDKDA